MMVSFIQSNYMAFGSGIVVPGTAISLQNRGLMFLDGQSLAECRLAGQAAVSYDHPGVSDAWWQTVQRFGAMGGDTQPQGHVQVLSRMLHYRQQPQAGCDVPCWKVNQDFSIDVEPQVSQQTISALQDLGHAINPLMIAIWISVPDISFGDSILTISIADSLRRATAVAMVSLRDFALAGNHAPESISRKPANGGLLTLRQVPVALALIEIPNQQC